MTTSAETQKWKDAYITLLEEYEGKGDHVYFVLYDFDRDSIPELIVVGSYEEEVYDSVFTFREDNVLALDYGEDISMANFILYARSRVMPPPDNSSGLINYIISPSTGTFGTSCYFSKIIIEGNKLIICDRGMSYIDVETLNEMFDNFGRDIDYDTLSVAIEENTYYYINDNSVSRDEWYAVFGNPYENDELQSLNLVNIEESDVHNEIYGWVPSITTD